MADSSEMSADTTAEIVVDPISESIPEFIDWIPESLLHYWQTLDSYPIVAALVIACLFYIIAFIIRAIVIRSIAKLTAKTATDVDDRVIDGLKKPIFKVVFFSGLTLSIKAAKLSWGSDLAINVLISLMTDLRNIRLRRVAALLCCFCLSPVVADDFSVALSAFSEQSTEPWKKHSFGSETDYRLLELDGAWALQAQSMASASAFYRSVAIDLDKTPYLHWRWRVEKSLSGLDEKSKSGDDYAARVYVVHKRGFFDKGVAINYVWSSGQDKGNSWPNAYAVQSSYMLALQDNSTTLSQWQYERRNVRHDFKTLLGIDVHEVQIVVLMTDTDNSGQSARSFYGDLRFSAR